MPTTLASRGVVTTLQNNQTTGNGLAVASPAMAMEHSFLILGNAGVAAGAIQIEEAASDPNFGGTWAPMGSPITVVANAEVAFHFTGALVFVRARISTTISGGGSPGVTVNYKPL